MSTAVIADHTATHCLELVDTFTYIYVDDVHNLNFALFMCIVDTLNNVAC